MITKELVVWDAGYLTMVFHFSYRFNIIDCVGPDVGNLLVVLFTRTIPITIIIGISVVTLVIILCSSKRIKSRIHYVQMPGTHSAVTSFPIRKYVGVISFSFILIWVPVLVNLVLHHLRLVGKLFCFIFVFFVFYDHT
jgi:hypothetical protein